MTLDTRARRAAQGIRRAVEVMEMSTSTQEPRKVERFDRFRDRKQRNRRIGALLVAAMLVIATIVLATTALGRRDTKVLVPPQAQNGRIVFGEQSRDGSTHLFTINPDGTDVRDLSVHSNCMSWAPDGSKILIESEGTGTSAWPATINPDGTGDTLLDASSSAAIFSLDLECGAFSPDGTRIVVGGSTELEPNHYNPREHGIFTMRASDGGDLVRLTPRNGTNPNYSPDGAQVVFEGVQGPHGACVPIPPGPKGGTATCPPGTDTRIGEFDGSVFVVNADGTGLHRIASNMVPPHFSPPSWSPDGRWILLSGGYVVHPDGTGLRRITLESVPRLRGVGYPSWSPDGTRFVFVGWTGSDRYNLFTARIDGTDVEQITHTHGIYYRNTDWGTNSG